LSNNDSEDKIGKLKRLISVLRGKGDIKSRVEVLLNPSKVETTTKLNPNQILFVASSKLLANTYPELEPLSDFADNIMFASISLEGWGVDNVIKLEQAINQQKIGELEAKKVEKK